MAFWRQLTHGVRGLVRGDAAERDRRDEVDHYFEEAVAALVARGLTPEEARRTARLDFGTALGVAEQASTYGWERIVGAFAADLRYAVRQLRASPGFTIVVSLTLALALGATTAIFSAVYPILFEPLPYPRAARLTTIADFGPEGVPQDVTFGTFLELVARNRTFDTLAVMRSWQPTLVGGAEPERLTGQRVSAGFFRAHSVTPGYLEAMRIPLRRGRRLDARDVAGAPRVALINESFANRVFPLGTAIGQRLRIGTSEGEPYTIVGVTGDVKQTSLAVGDADAVYVTLPQWHWVDNVMSLVVRARGDAAALAPAVRSAIWSVDRNQPIVRVATLERLLARTEADRRFALMLFEAFGVAALLLAATGIYGVLAGSVAERTREIGVRAALGASRTDILALVARQALTLTAIGGAIGLVGAAAASDAIVTLLFGVSRLDPATYLGVAALLAAVSAAAALVPAWRAARVDPAITLRSE